MNDREIQRERLALDREWVRQTASCPTCKADIGERCRGRKFLLVRNHGSRTDFAMSGYLRKPSVGLD